MQTLIYTLRVHTTKANADALLEYFDRHSGARALLTEAECEEIADLCHIAMRARVLSKYEARKSARCD